MKTKQRNVFFVIGSLTGGLALSFFGLTSAGATSTQPPGGGMGGGRMAMSEEFIANSLSACEDASANDECSFSADDEDVEGICQTGPQGSDLVCMPERSEDEMGGGGRGQGQDQERGQVMNRTETKAEMTQGQNAMSIEQGIAKQKTSTTRVVNRIEKIITYLEDNGVDTTEIESQLAIFEDKSTDLAAAYTAYAQLDDDSDDDTVSEIKENIKTLATAVKSYFQETLKVSIQDALLELT